MREIGKIVVHCTDSEYGDVEAIRSWHLQRGWDDIGYHFVIGNAYPTYADLKNRRPNPAHDGAILEGRDIQHIGAHCRGHNYDSIGVALVGVNTFSKAQLQSLVNLLKLLMQQYHIGLERVYGHYELDGRKSCPNIDMEYFRKEIYQ